MKSAPNQLSFLPDDYLERKAQRRSNAVCAALFLIVMVGMGTAFAYTDRSLRGLESQHAEVEKNFTDAAVRIKQVQDMQDKQRKMAQQADLTASLLEKVPRSYLIAEVTNSMPPGVSLLDFAMDSKVKSIAKSEAAPTQAFEKKKPGVKAAAKAAADEAPVAKPKTLDVTIKISGIADTDVQVAQFINRLGRSRVLRDVNLVISDEYKPREVEAADARLRKFVIEMALDPAATILPTEAKVVSTAVPLAD